MNVYQTRSHFLKKYGRLLNEPRIGADLAKIYWAPGNTELFFDLVKSMTGSPLTADAWVAVLAEPVEDLLKREKAEYDAGVAEAKEVVAIELGCRLELVHGDHVIADSQKEDGFLGACAKFKAWTRETFFKGEDEPAAKRVKA